jgi:hypothetical protein
MTTVQRPPNQPRRSRRTPPAPTSWRDHVIGAVLSLVTGVVLLGSAPFWWDDAGRLLGGNDPAGSSGSRGAAGQGSPASGAEHSDASDGPGNGVTSLIGGCGGFQLYAQNRWAPFGAAVRESPSPAARQVAGIPGNGIVYVDGWIHGPVAYPLDSAPWNSDAWFHLADGTGWVSFAGTRAVPTDQDPTGRADGGIPAPTPPDCEGSI